MNLIILAAGMGSRLRPLTDKLPKAMVKVAGKPLIEWTLGTASQLSFDNIVIVTGYRGEAFEPYPVIKVKNQAYNTTNMVESLFCASEFFGDGFILSYGDIVYEKDVLKALADSSDAISVVVDRQWKSYWQERFEDPLSDAETLVTNENNKILEIGKTPLNYEHIHGQYIGLMKFQDEGVAKLKAAYATAKAQDEAIGSYFDSGRSLASLYMTDLLQGMIEQGCEVNAIDIRGGWLEVDSIKDKDIADKAIREKRVKL